MDYNQAATRPAREDEIRELQESNKRKQKRLQQLAEEYERELASSSASTARAAAPSLKDQVTALQVELSLLQQAKPTSADATRIPKSSRRLARDFATEVLHSYEETKQLVEVLEQVLKVEQKKLNTKETFLAEYELILKSLQERVKMETEELQQQSNLKKAAKSTEIDEEGPDTGSESPHKTKVQRENEWIRDELHYVSVILSPLENDEEETEASKDKSQTARKSKRKKKKEREGDKSAASTSATPSSESSSLSIDDSRASVEEAVLRLTQRFLDNTRHPYLEVIGAYPDAPPSRQYDPRYASKIDLLRQCGVVSEHPDNKNWVCLNDYRT